MYTRVKDLEKLVKDKKNTLGEVRTYFPDIEANRIRVSESLNTSNQDVDDMDFFLKETNVSNLEDMERLNGQLKKVGAKKISWHNVYTKVVQVGCNVMKASFDNALKQVELLYSKMKISRDKFDYEWEVMEGKLIPPSEASSSANISAY